MLRRVQQNLGYDGANVECTIMVCLISAAGSREESCVTDFFITFGDCRKKLGTTPHRADDVFGGSHRLDDGFASSISSDQAPTDVAC